MADGLYPAVLVVERYSATVSAETLGQKFIAPFDFDVIGLVAILGTAPGGSDGVVFNISNSPTSQLSKVAAYDLWTATNVPSILGTATASFATSTTSTVIENTPYPLDYPLPGPSGTTGYETSQATTQITTDPVTVPPSISIYQLDILVAPDNTYTDYNGYTLAASYVHAGDVLSFVLSAGGTGDAVGAAAELELVLYGQKH